jgi:hypothetical protein
MSGATVASIGVGELVGGGIIGTIAGGLAGAAVTAIGGSSIIGDAIGAITGSGGNSQGQGVQQSPAGVAIPGGVAPQTSGKSDTSGGTGPFQGLGDYNTAGVRISTRPEEGESQYQKPTSPLVKPGYTPEAAKATTGFGVTRRTPANPDFEGNVKSDLNNVWADRLSKYLDYNTRSLG